MYIGKFVNLLKHIYTLFVVCIGWVLFRADDITMAGAQLRQMFLPSGNGYWNVTEFVDPITFAIFIISLIGALGLWRKITEKCAKFTAAAEICSGTAAIVILFLSIVMLANASHNPFIYFRF